MKAENYSQVDLFSKNSSYRDPRLGSKTFLSRIWIYEKTILLAIGFIITAIAAFSLGVEKGKRLAAIRNGNEMRFDTVNTTRPAGVINPSKVAPMPPKPETAFPSKPKEELTNYTIQVASYKNRELAENESAALKRKGFSPALITRGGYIVLCVGKFPTKGNAKPLLSELEKKYQGCFVRRI